MCTACGLPTTHVNTISTLSLVATLGGGVIAFLWVYAVMTHARVKRGIRKIIDYYFPTTNH